jgi:hypothetical protein
MNMTTEEQDKIRLEGYHAFWYVDYAVNPYKENTDEYDWWSIGFLEGFNSQYEEYRLS